MPKPPNTELIVFACSGASDAGELADRIARQLSRTGEARMSCIAGIGGGVKSILADAAAARQVLVIDGCPFHCARRTMLAAGLSGFRHLALPELGFKKGACVLSEASIALGVAAAADRLLCSGKPPGDRPDHPA
ncbi:MAG: putative zinc-binding protein [Verrucomicrobiota bacterium]